MTYEIRSNPQFNSNEIYFEGKPSESVRDALKALKFRWHSVKKCWYGFAAEHEIVNAILGTSTEEAPATVVSDGYLGGGAIYGSKSNLHLYGADLAKAIREDIKKAGIKGVTIASKHGNIQATIRTTSADVLTLEEYKAAHSREFYRHLPYWIEWLDENDHLQSVHRDAFLDMEPEVKEEILDKVAELEYRKEILNECGLNHYCLDRYTGFTPAGMAKIEAVRDIIAAYRFDESNSMVDYFHTNFYFDIYTKPAA